MELLRTAVVDITTLVATCHALKAAPAQGGQAVPRKLRSQLRREVKRATVAYINTLARSRRGAVDEALLGRCRVAAEEQMRHALAHQVLLGRIMASEAGSLDGLVAARQDLWRLAHIAIHLGRGMAAWRESAASADGKSAEAVAARLRRRVRRSMVAYARAALRPKTRKSRLIANAREAALAQLGPRGPAEAERLADVESDADPARSVMRQGVLRPLMDLALDWQRKHAGPA